MNACEPVIIKPGNVHWPVVFQDVDIDYAYAISSNTTPTAQTAATLSILENSGTKDHSIVETSAVDQAFSDVNTEDYTFTGAFYTQTTEQNDNNGFLKTGDYIIQNNQFIQVDTSAGAYRMKGYRGWFRNNVSSAKALASMSLITVENGETSEILRIEDLDNDSQSSTLSPRPTTLYNLAGQQVNSSYKGIVIKNGKKVLQ